MQIKAREVRALDKLALPVHMNALLITVIKRIDPRLFPKRVKNEQSSIISLKFRPEVANWQNSHF